MTAEKSKPVGILRQETALWTGAVTAALFFLFGDAWLADLANPVRYGLLMLWVFVIMMWLAFAVVRHADSLAVILGEPYGTLILTVSVISIEVIVIVAVMITGGDNPTLARDTIFSVIMIVLNGLLGISLLVGGLKHHQQIYNLEGAGAYLAVLVPLGGLGLIMPRYTSSAPGGEVSLIMGVFLLVMSFALYLAFLAIQTTRHRSFFAMPSTGEAGADTTCGAHGDLAVRSIGYHALFLPLSMVPIVMLSKKMAVLVDHGIGTLGAPQALGGFLIAILVLSPEMMVAVQSALQNNLQRALNISLGSALATIGLTIPAVLVISIVTGKPVELGLELTEVHLLLLTFIVSIISFNGRTTNMLHGIVHLVLFMTYIVLIFD